MTCPVHQPGTTNLCLEWGWRVSARLDLAGTSRRPWPGESKETSEKARRKKCLKQENKKAKFKKKKKPSHVFRICFKLRSSYVEKWQLQLYESNLENSMHNLILWCVMIGAGVPNPDLWVPIICPDQLFLCSSACL